MKYKKKMSLLWYLTLTLLIGIILFFYKIILINKKGAVFKYFTFTNILVGIFTVLVISVTKWLGIPLYIINYIFSCLPAEYTILAEYSILGLIGLFFRLIFKGIFEDFYSIPLDNNLHILKMDNNPLSESEPNKTPTSYGGSKATSSDIKELEPNTDTKDSSGADSKNYSADDQQNNNSSSDKGKSLETSLPSSETSLPSSETPLSNPVSKQASSWEEWNARKGNNSSYSANKLSSRLLREQKQLNDLLKLLSLEASNSESPESFKETQKEFDKVQDRLAQITFATMDKDLIAASTSTNSQDWSKSDPSNKRVASEEEERDSNKKSKE